MGGLRRRTELGGGLSFEERIALAQEEKLARFRKEAAVNTGELKRCRSAGVRGWRFRGLFRACLARF